MHNVSIRQHIVDRVVARRGDIHWFIELDPRTSALVIVDMQNTFCLPGAPGEVPTARDIVPAINDLAARMRDLGVPVIWVLHTNTQSDGVSDWEVFFNHVVRNPDVKKKMVDSLAPENQKVWDDLIVHEDDTVIIKNRYSALAHGSSNLERVLRSRGIDTILVGGTKTNVCCDSTARDAMMLDFKSVMVSDCCAASSDDEHLASLETFIQQFGDVMTSEEVMDRMIRRNDAAAAE
ncbi:MAG: isochorismatase family protein [Alphaproteobacteria bacterium]